MSTPQGESELVVWMEGCWRMELMQVGSMLLLERGWDGSDVGEGGGRTVGVCSMGLGLWGGGERGGV